MGYFLGAGGLEFSDAGGAAPANRTCLCEPRRAINAEQHQEFAGTTRSRAVRPTARFRRRAGLELNAVTGCDPFDAGSRTGRRRPVGVVAIQRAGQVGVERRYLLLVPSAPFVDIAVQQKRCADAMADFFGVAVGELVKAVANLPEVLVSDAHRFNGEALRKGGEFGRGVNLLGKGCVRFEPLDCRLPGGVAVGLMEPI